MGGIASSRVPFMSRIATRFSSAGGKLGSIHNVMIDKHSGRVIYAVMSFGGFLGIGERYHPLPWGMLY